MINFILGFIVGCLSLIGAAVLGLVQMIRNEDKPHKPKG